MLNPQFIKNFSIPELKYIAGNRYINLFILSCILIISMLAIGLGNGAIKYLDKKMNNPFVSFVNVKIPMGNPFTIENMKEIHAELELDRVKSNSLYKSSSFLDYFGFGQPYPVYDNYVNFTNRAQNITRQAKVRKGSISDPIYDFIISQEMSSKTSISYNNNFNPLGWGCVVSLDFLKNDSTKLKYKNDVPFLQYRRNIDGQHKFFSIPIEGVVSSFPGGVDMIVGEKLFSAFNNYDFWYSLSPTIPAANSKNYLQYYVNNNDTLEDFWKSNGFVEIEYDNLLSNNGVMLRKNKISHENSLKTMNNLPKSDNLYRVYDFNRGTNNSKINNIAEHFVFQFKKDRLTSIEKFNSFLKTNTLHDKKTLSIDMSVIESKKNFDLFNKLATLLSMALIFFSIFSIVLYITNLIVSHISKNKMNLGTLKAFGLSNNSIILIYSSISIALITSAFIFSYFISSLVGNFSINLIAHWFDIGDSSTLNYISDSIYSLISFFIIIPSLCIYIKLWFTLRDSTPGDLIYGRD